MLSSLNQFVVQEEKDHSCSKPECLHFKCTDEELPPIYHGNPITDRRSTFQAHLAPVVSTKQVSFSCLLFYPHLSLLLRELDTCIPMNLLSSQSAFIGVKRINLIIK